MSLIMMARAACRGPASVAQSIGIAPDDDTVSVVQGGTVQIVYTLTRVGGYSGTVTPAVTGLPSGVSGAWSDSSLAGGDTTTTLTLTATGGATEVTNDAFTVTFSGAGVSDAVDAGTVTVTASGGYDIDVEFHRWASSSGTTLYDIGVPLQEGQLSDVANCSVWKNGSEIAVYAEGLGAWPDGSFRSLYLQASESGVNGAPIAGGINLTGGFGPSRLSRTDNSATWRNSNSTTWYSGGTGIPEGVIWPTSATHLCAASSFGKLITKASQPSFTNSTAVDSTFDTALTGTVDAWNGALISGATYERCIALWHQASRTADVTCLKRALAFASRYCTLYWAANFASGLPEWEQVQKSWLWLYLIRRDTDALVGIKKVASDIYINGSGNVGTEFHTENPRYVTTRIKAAASALKAGLGATQNNYTTGTYAQMADALVVEGLATGSTKMTQTDNRITLNGYASDGTTAIRTSFPYMAALYIMAFVELLDCQGSSANKTSMIAQLSASILKLRTDFAGTSAGGTHAYLYQDVDNYYQAVPGTVAAGGYTSGSSSIPIDIDTGSGPPTGWPVSGLFSPGSVIRIAGVGKALTAQLTTNSSGIGTATIESGGFGSSYSAGQALTFIRDSAVGVNYENVDLNGFLAPLFAWRAYNDASTTDADEARTLYATIAETPQDGSNGPFITAQKQWDESFNQLFPTMYYLNASGL